jgi:hypothetical protein
MPLKLNVGLSKKIGQPDYGSLGASCHVEVELDAALLHNDLDGFHRHVRSVFVACQQAVNDELSRHSESSATSHRNNGQGNGTPTGSANNTNGTSYRASDKQLNYARRLASQIPNLGRLELLVDQMFSKSTNDLTGFEASSLIDQLKAMKEGQVAVPDSSSDGVPA